VPLTSVGQRLSDSSDLLPRSGYYSVCRARLSARGDWRVAGRLIFPARIWRDGSVNGRQGISSPIATAINVRHKYIGDWNDRLKAGCGQAGAGQSLLVNVHVGQHSLSLARGQRLWGGSACCAWSRGAVLSSRALVRM